MAHTERDYALAVELAEEAMGYVSDYFRQKWDMDRRLCELMDKVDPDVAVELWTVPVPQLVERHKRWRAYS